MEGIDLFNTSETQEHGSVLSWVYSVTVNAKWKDPEAGCSFPLNSQHNSQDPSAPPHSEGGTGNELLVHSCSGRNVIHTAWILAD